MDVNGNKRDPRDRPVVTVGDTLVSGVERTPRRRTGQVAFGLVAVVVAAMYLPGEVRQFQANRAESRARALLAVGTSIEDAAGGDTLTMNVHVTNTGPRPVLLSAISFAGSGITVRSLRLPSDTIDPGQGGRASVDATVACGAPTGDGTTIVQARTADGRLHTTLAHTMPGGMSLADVVALACGGTPSE